MSEERNNMQEWLQTYSVPPVSEKKIEKLISMGKSYMNSPDFNKKSLWNMLLNQLQYLSISFWVVQTTLAAMAMILVCLLGYWQVPFYYPLTTLSIIIPLLVLLGVREISKSNTYDMWEIEQSSRIQLVKIIACRMLIIGLLDLFFVTGILIRMSCYYQQSIIGMILYGMVPFNISCISYLFTLTKNEKGQISYHLIACMICLASAFSFILKQQFLFEASMLWGWGAFYFLSAILLGKAIQKYLKHEKMIGELAWNLQ